MSALALIGFVAWTVLLVVVMETVRTVLILRGKIQPSALRPDNGNLSAFMQRLSRAHANCLENLPIVGALLLLAIARQQTSLTDALAPVALGARVAQTTIHLASASNLAVTLRFLAYLVQLVIWVVWILVLSQAN